MLVMERHHEVHSRVSVRDPLGTKTDHGEQSNRYSGAGNNCNQCDYVSINAGSLRTHLKTHTVEKSSKCNQCDYASSQASGLRRHLKTHTGEKSNKCYKCDILFSQQKR